MKSKLLLKLLAVLGFGAVVSSCSVDEYGSPYAEFEVKGKVVDEEGDPIEGIKVTLNPGSYSGGGDFTDIDGEYYILDKRWSWTSGTFDVVAEDTGGEENGVEYATQIKTVTLESSDFNGGKGWYQGKASKTVDFVLGKFVPEEDGGENDVEGENENETEHEKSDE